VQTRAIAASGSTVTGGRQSRLMAFADTVGFVVLHVACGAVVIVGVSIPALVIAMWMLGPTVFVWAFCISTVAL
jgi:hypothetical protein